LILRYRLGEKITFVTKKDGCSQSQAQEYQS
jgi:hypothetical protein